MDETHDFDAFDSLLKSAFKTDYSIFKREYERDQVKVEKIFWSTVLGIYHEHGKIDFESTFRVLIAILYDRPSMEVILFNRFDGVSHSDYKITHSQAEQLVKKFQQGEKVKQELIHALEDFVQMSEISRSFQIINLKLKKNHQPHLPSISMAVNALRSKAKGKLINGPLHYPFHKKLTLPQLNDFRQLSEAYQPFFLLKVLDQRLHEWLKLSTESFHFKKRVRSVSTAVAYAIVTYPWEINYTNSQLAHRIFNYYADLEGNNFKPNSILKAIKRFRDE
jgi:hypothetical protein